MPGVGPADQPLSILLLHRAGLLTGKSQVGRWGRFPICPHLFVAALLLTLPAAAVLVDRIAIAAGNKVITDSEIDLRIRLTAFQNAEKPAFTLDARKKAAQLLIDQKLVEREMDVGHYPRLSAEARKQLLANFAKDYFKNDPAAMHRTLIEYGLTEDDLEADLARESDVLTFLSLRFRPAVSEANAQLANKRADADMDAWLSDQRKRTKIEYLEKELAP